MLFKDRASYILSDMPQKLREICYGREFEHKNGHGIEKLFHRKNY